MTKETRNVVIIAAIIALCMALAFVYFQQAQKQDMAMTAPPVSTEAEMPAQAAAVDVVPNDITPPVIEGAPPMPETAVTSEDAPVSAPAAVSTTASSVGGAFSLTDHKGNAVTEKSWPGKQKLVFFGFTHCPDICPAAMQKLSAVMDSYDAEGAKLAPLFITVDPARDTPEVMASYIAGFNKSITGLTGTEEQIKAVESVYKVYASKAAGTTPEDYMMDHSAYIFLMSPDDQLLEIFDSEATAEGMFEKIKLHQQ